MKIYKKIELNELLKEEFISWMDEEDKNLYGIIANLLGKIYYQTKWYKIATNKISTDIFEHRIKVASNKRTVSKFVSKLCNFLSIQALHEFPELVFEAEQHTKKILRIIRTESQLCTMLAKRYSDYLKDQKQKEKDKQ